MLLAVDEVEKQVENNLFKRLTFWRDFIAVELLSWRLTGMQSFLGASLWIADQKSPGVLSFEASSLK